MRDNRPITQTEYAFPEPEMLVSTTDARGVTTHCNASFERVSRLLRDAERLATELAACNLMTHIVDYPYPPLGAPPTRLRQIQIYLRAVVGDARDRAEHGTASTIGTSL